jgi:hypothetical protein
VVLTAQEAKVKQQLSMPVNEAGISTGAWAVYIGMGSAKESDYIPCETMKIQSELSEVGTHTVVRAMEAEGAGECAF